MSLFRLDSSIRTEGSVTREVADTVERAYRAEHPHATVVRRDVGTEPLPADLWPVAAIAGRTPEDQRTDEQRAALARTAELADELLGTDAAVITAPLYNFGVPTPLKAWIDVLVNDPRFGPGTTPLTGRRVTIVIARGGGYGVGTPREGWDHATAYLQRIFGDVWGAEVTIVAAELTLADVVPAMSELRPLAAQLKAQAHELAEVTGKALSRSAA